MFVRMLALAAVVLASAAGAARADTLFSPPLVADGTNFFDCYLVNVSLKPRKVRIDVISREGDVVESVETTLGPGQEDVARATSDLRPRYCKFVVQGAKQLYRASVLVRQDGVGAISALPAQ